MYRRRSVGRLIYTSKKAIETFFFETTTKEQKRKKKSIEFKNKAVPQPLKPSALHGEHNLFSFLHFFNAILTTAEL